MISRYTQNVPEYLEVWLCDNGCRDVHQKTRNYPEKFFNESLLMVFPEYAIYGPLEQRWKLHQSDRYCKQNSSQVVQLVKR